MKQKIVIGSLTAILVAVTVVAIGTAAFREQALRAPDGRISALKRAPGAADTLPAALLALPIAERFADPADARRVATVGRRSYYLIPGRDDSVCLVYTSGTGTDLVSAGACGARAAFLSNGIWFSEVLSQDRVELSLVVPDGYERATTHGRSVRVLNNVAVFSPGPVDDVTLDGGGMSPLRVDLGVQVDR